MKPLQTNQQVLTWLCVYPTNEKMSKFKKFLCIVVSVAVFFGYFNVLLASIAFFLKYASTSLEQSLYALFQISGDFGTAYMMLAAYTLRKQFKIIFDKLSDIYDACKYNFDSFL